MPGERYEGAPEISRTAIFDLLSDPRRLATLQYLASRDDPVTVTELSQMVAEAIGDEECNDAPVAVKRLRLMLYHAHLPRLDAEGIVDFDSSENRVALTTRGERVVAYLNQIEEISF